MDSLISGRKGNPPPVFREEPRTSALVILHYAYPIFLLFFFFTAFGVWSVYATPIEKQHILRSLDSSKDLSNGQAGENGTTKAKVKKTRKPLLGRKTRIAFHWALVGVFLTFVLDVVVVVMHSVADRGWWCGQDTMISTIALLFMTAVLLIHQLDSEHYPVLPHATTWMVMAAGETLVLWQVIASIYTLPHRKRFDKWESAHIAIGSFRIIWLGLMSSIWMLLYCLNKRKEKQESGEASEDTSLLADGEDAESQAGYGAISNGSASKQAKKDDLAPWARREKIPEGSWWDYVKGYTMFFPYLWPSKDRMLQLLVLVCVVIVLIQRAINVLVPAQLGKITNILGGEDGQNPRLPWLEITLYIAYRLLQGNMGILGNIRYIAWLPIDQYSYRMLSTSAFEHVHSLSLDFHLGKKTGEVLSALSKGASINNFFEMIMFQVVPLLLDLVFAFFYFIYKFDAYYALIIVIVTTSYMYVTIRLASWRQDIRREMVNKSREEAAVKNDSMIAYETVKYFNAEDYEFARYRQAVENYQKAEKKVTVSLNILNVSQNALFTTGLAVSCYLMAYQISTGQARVGDLVTLITYMAQIQGPLNFFGTIFRSIQSNMINAERLLELYKEQPTVVDSADAKTMPSCTGEIEFKNVEFSYDQRKSALNGLTFTAKPGTTTAFVGESGGGKTTVLRLLFRFYNVSGGAVEVDGIDVRDVTINSLREKIGVVPQDTVLFNETLMYNLKYARQDATEEEVIDACKAASIHDKILTFPDGYDTKVGERGLRLSGGEKQRIAIARTLLKNPRIIMLDEATASLDSETEQHVQSALKELTAGRTTLVIAHRLSTITSADQIVVMHEGRAEEIGTHDELLEQNGKYASLWAKQIRAERNARKIKKLEREDDSDEQLSTGYITPAIVVSETGETEAGVISGRPNPQPEISGAPGVVNNPAPPTPETQKKL